jgi:hypothetical protein
MTDKDLTTLKELVERLVAAKPEEIEKKCGTRKFLDYCADARSKLPTRHMAPMSAPSQDQRGQKKANLTVGDFKPMPRCRVRAGSVPERQDYPSRGSGYCQFQPEIT